MSRQALRRSFGRSDFGLWELLVELWRALVTHWRVVGLKDERGLLVEGLEVVDAGHRRLLRQRLLELLLRGVAVHHGILPVSQVTFPRTGERGGLAIVRLFWDPHNPIGCYHGLLSMPPLPLELLKFLNAPLQAQFGLQQRALAQFLDEILPHCPQLLLSEQVVVDLVLECRLFRLIKVKELGMPLLIVLDVHLDVRLPLERIVGGVVRVQLGVCLHVVVENDLVIL